MKGVERGACKQPAAKPGCMAGGAPARLACRLRVSQTLSSARSEQEAYTLRIQNSCEATRGRILLLGLDRILLVLDLVLNLVGLHVCYM